MSYDPVEDRFWDGAESSEVTPTRTSDTGLGDYLAVFLIALFGLYLVLQVVRAWL